MNIIESRGVLGESRCGQVLHLLLQVDGLLVDAACKPLLRETCGERALLSLKHPHIIKAYGYLHREGVLYIVMDACLDGTLEAAMRSTTMQEPKLCKYVWELIEAIQYIHLRCSPPLLHGDIKPANCFIRDGTLQLGDFGSACFEAVALPQPISPLYYPLQAQERPIPSRRADLWAAGITIVQLMRPTVLTRLLTTMAIVDFQSHYRDLWQAAHGHHPALRTALKALLDPAANWLEQEGGVPHEEHVLVSVLDSFPVTIGRTDHPYGSDLEALLLEFRTLGIEDETRDILLRAARALTTGAERFRECWPEYVEALSRLHHSSTYPFPQTSPEDTWLHGLTGEELHQKISDVLILLLGRRPHARRAWSAALDYALLE
ncbi:Kinase, NEK [Giardia muris]|uniref:Kinase, NEK n=1 Tax=Giardia muris TaxID=5742 RepID=A0A4Z1T5Y0_GIAMU|nr:Kinase, NEK [Giardia muris]|eukprot:TNJ27871.1 Kinase, NEK [Giardia muris]